MQVIVPIRPIRRRVVKALVKHFQSPCKVLANFQKLFTKPLQAPYKNLAKQLQSSFVDKALQGHLNRSSR